MACQNNDNNRGAVYQFNISGGFVRKLVAHDGATNQRFGSSIAADDDFVAVASSHDDTAANNAGAVYLYDVTHGALLHKLIAPDGSVDIQWGKNDQLSLAKGQLFVGASKFNSDAGVVYHFDAVNGWYLRHIVAEPSVAGEKFGECATNGDQLWAGAPKAGDQGPTSGAAYVYTISTGGLVEKVLQPGGSNLDRFGEDLAVSHEYAIVSSIKGDGVCSKSGAAFVFAVKTGGFIVRLQEATCNGNADAFGTSVAVAGSYAIVGAPSWNSNEGKVYVFELPTGTLLRTLTAPDAAPNDYFGADVAMFAAYAVVGSPMTGTAGANGKAYVFNVATGGFIAKLEPPDGGTNCGHKVATQFTTTTTTNTTSTSNTTIISSVASTTTNTTTTTNTSTHEVPCRSATTNTTTTNTTLYIYLLHSVNTNSTLSTNSTSTASTVTTTRSSTTTFTTLTSTNTTVGSNTTGTRGFILTSTDSAVRSKTSSTARTDSTNTMTSSAYVLLTSTHDTTTSGSGWSENTTSCALGSVGIFEFLGHKLRVQSSHAVQDGDYITYACNDHLDNWRGNFSVGCVQGHLKNFHSGCIATIPEDPEVIAVLNQVDEMAVVDGPLVMLSPKSVQIVTTVAVQKVSVSTLAARRLQVSLGTTLVSLPSEISPAISASYSINASAIKIAIVEYNMMAFKGLLNTSRRLAGPFVSVDISALPIGSATWSHVSISDLSEPIILRLPLALQDGDTATKINLACGFWDPAYGEVSASGIELLNVSDEGVFCSSTHLTLFATFHKAGSLVASCGKFFLFSAESGFFANFDWVITQSGILILILILLSSTLVLLAIYDDCKVRIEGLWCDEDFLTLDPQYATKMNDKLNEAPSWTEYVTNLVHILAAEASRMLLAAELRISVRDLNLTLQRRHRHRWNTIIDKERHTKATVSATMGLVRESALSWEDLKGVLFKAYCRHPFWQFVQMFIFLQPINTMTNHTLSMPRYLRVLIFNCRMYGALCLSTIFYLLSGKAVARNTPDECRPAGGGLWTSTFFGILSFTSSNWATLLLMLLHRRSFVYKERWTPRTKYWQLCKWWALDGFLVTVTLVYSFMCLYVTCVFISRVSDEDNFRFFFSAIIGICEDWAVTPSILSIVMVASVAAVYRRDSFLEKVHKELGLHEEDDEKDILEDENNSEDISAWKNLKLIGTTISFVDESSVLGKNSDDVTKKCSLSTEVCVDTGLPSFTVASTRAESTDPGYRDFSAHLDTSGDLNSVEVDRIAVHFADDNTQRHQYLQDINGDSEIHTTTCIDSGEICFDEAGAPRKSLGCTRPDSRVNPREPHEDSCVRSDADVGDTVASI